MSKSKIDLIPVAEPPAPGRSRAARASQLFNTDDLQHGLGRRTARGGLITGANTAYSFVVTMVSTILVTRNLTDEDFGLYGMVVVFTGLAGMFVDFGLSRAVIQKPQITHEQVSTLFWINLGLSLIVGVTVLSATPLIVWFYNEPRLTSINIVLAGIIGVSALTTQHRALMTRRMEFGRLNILSAIATTVATISSVVVAILGGGVWALVALPVVNQLVNICGLWAICGWVPGPPRRHTGTRAMLAFGGHVTGFQFINYFARNADNIMLGYAWGAGPLGLYTRAYSLMMLPSSKINEPLTNVLVPGLSRLLHDPDRYNTAYLKSLKLLAGITTFIIFMLLLLGEELIPLLLGENWIGIIPVFYALSPAAILGATNVATGWLYLSIGHVHRQLQWSYVMTSATIIASALGLQWGHMGVAIAISIIMVVMRPIGIHFATRNTPVKTLDIIKNITAPIILMSVGSCTSYIIAKSIAANGSLIGILVLKLIFFVLIVNVLLLIFFRKSMKEYAALFKFSFN